MGVSELVRGEKVKDFIFKKSSGKTQCQNILQMYQYTGLAFGIEMRVEHR